MENCKLHICRSEGNDMLQTGEVKRGGIVVLELRSRYSSVETTRGRRKKVC